MIKRRPKDKNAKVDPLIDVILKKMDDAGPESPEYLALMNGLERLYELKAKDRPERLSRDTLALVAGNLLGILLIIAYEQKHVITSKGMTQIRSPKQL